MNVPSVVVDIGMEIIKNHRAEIVGFVKKGLEPLITFITPYIIPALEILCISVVAVLAVISIAYLTKKVADWIMLQFA